MKLLSRLKREFIVALSKVCLRSARNNYEGIDLRYPIIYGMGRGYAVQGDFWMGQSLRAFVETKQGCVIDIGANVGIYLVKLRAISGDIDYIGFEPNAVCNFYLNELIRMNGFCNAKVLPLALSDKPEIRTLYAKRLGDRGASMLYEIKRNESTLEFTTSITCVRGDDFIQILDIEDISAIKIDVEGVELEVMQGMAETIKKYRPYLYTEVLSSFVDDESLHVKENISGIYEFITSLGYSVLGLSDENILEEVTEVRGFIGRIDPNYLFVPEEMLGAFVGKVQSIPGCEVKVDEALTARTYT